MSKQHNYDAFYGGWYSKPGGFGGGGITPVASSVTLQMGAMFAYSDLEYPTHWSVAFAKGTVPAATTFYLRETPVGGTVSTVVSKFNPISYWPDGSIRWMHIYGNAKWSGGNPCDYAIKMNATYPSAPTSPLVVSESATGYNINTGATSFVLPKAYPGIIGQGIAGGGPVIVDSSGNSYRPSGNIITVEESGAARFSVRMEASYVCPSVNSFAKYITRVTAYQNSAIVNFDHATIFTDDMRNHKIASMGVEFSGSTKQILTRFLAEKAPASISGNNFWQWPAGLPDTNTAADYQVTNTGGFPSAGVNKHKFVNTIAYQCQWLKKGPYLDINVPTGYLNTFAAFDVTTTPPGALSSTGEDELTVAGAQSGHAIGVANHYEFAINLGTSGAALQTVYENKPIGGASPIYNSNSMALGRRAGFQNDEYAAIDNFTINAVKGLFGHYTRYNEGHWATFGAMHHEEQIMSNKPQIHRNINVNHYNHGTAIWGIYAASADTGILKWARANIDYYTSIGQQKIDKPAGLPAGHSRLYKGAYRHAKQFTPWGQTPSGGALEYEDMARIGHECDPGGQLYAWYLDDNRWAYEGFTDWYSGVQNIADITTGSPYNDMRGASGAQISVTNFRNTINALHGMILGYEDNPTQSMSGIIQTIGNQHATQTFLTVTPTNYFLFNPEWASKFYELFPTNTGIADWFNTIVASTGYIDYAPGGPWPYDGGITWDAQYGQAKLFDSWTMAAAASYYDINPNTSYLTKFSGVLSKFVQRIATNTNNPAWENFGNYMGPVVNEGGFVLQWPRLRYALKKASIGLVTVPEPGTWLGAQGAYNDPADHTGCSAQIYTILTGGPNYVTPKRVSIAQGGLQPFSMYVLQSGTKGTIRTILDSEDYFRPGGFRPSANIQYTSSGYAIPATGLCKLLFTGYEPILYKDSIPGDAVQLIRDYRFGSSSSANTAYRTAITSGVIYPIVTGTIQVIASSIGPNAIASISLNGAAPTWMIPSSVYTGTITGPTTLSIYVENGNGASLGFIGLNIPTPTAGNPGKLALYGTIDAITNLLPAISGANYF